MQLLDVFAVLRGHWKSLTPEAGSPRLDDARLVFACAPGAFFVLALLFSWHLSAPTPFLTAVSLLIGGSLTVFAQLVNLRSRIRDDLDDEWVEKEKGAVDQTVNHLLTAVLFAIATAALLVVYMNVASEEPPGPDAWGSLTVPEAWTAVSNTNFSSLVRMPTITTLLTALIAAMSTYLVLLLTVCVPKLYLVYTRGFRVSRKNDGHHASL